MFECYCKWFSHHVISYLLLKCTIYILKLNVKTLLPAIDSIIDLQKNAYDCCKVELSIETILDLMRKLSSHFKLN